MPDIEPAAICKIGAAVFERLRTLHREAVTHTDVERLGAAIGCVQMMLDGQGSIELIVERGHWRFTRLQVCANQSLRLAMSRGIEHMTCRHKVTVPPELIHDIETTTAIIKAISGFGAMTLDVTEMRVANFSITFDKPHNN
jgi:hypothetical protein